MKERVSGWSTDSYFKNMSVVGKRDDGWRSILQCASCGQNWLVDEYDRVQSLFAIKIDSPTDLSEEKFLRIHKKHLIERHGGESKEECRMAGCNNKAVKEMAFCAQCLITKQGVYE